MNTVPDLAIWLIAAAIPAFFIAGSLIGSWFGKHRRHGKRQKPVFFISHKIGPERPIHHGKGLTMEFEQHLQRARRVTFAPTAADGTPTVLDGDITAEVLDGDHETEVTGPLQVRVKGTGTTPTGVFKVSGDGYVEIDGEDEKVEIISETPSVTFRHFAATNLNPTLGDEEPI